MQPKYLPSAGCHCWEGHLLWELCTQDGKSNKSLLHCAWGWPHPVGNRQPDQELPAPPVQKRPCVACAGLERMLTGRSKSLCLSWPSGWHFIGPMDHTYCKVLAKFVIWCLWLWVAECGQGLSAPSRCPLQSFLCPALHLPATMCHQFWVLFLLTQGHCPSTGRPLRKWLSILGKNERTCQATLDRWKNACVDGKHLDSS